MKENKIVQLSEREHVLHRSSRYIGSTKPVESNMFIFDDKENKITNKDIIYVPALNKIIREVLDNSIDEAIRTNFKFANIISLNISDDGEIVITDNGRGIPSTKINGKFSAEVAWTSLRAGSNFGDEVDNKNIGSNGEGASLANISSSYFLGESCDGKLCVKVHCTDNMKNIKTTATPARSSTKQFTKVAFKPDYKRFNVKNINDFDNVHINLLKTDLINLAITFPGITFKYNNKKINPRNFKEYMKYYSEDFVISETEGLKIGIFPSTSDDFKFVNIINGINSFDGGSPLNWCVNSTVKEVFTKLFKKYKNIKQGDIKNKLNFVVFFTNMSNPKFDSQTKSKCVNTYTDFKKDIEELDFVKFGAKIISTENLSGPIIDYYKIKTETLKRKELGKLSKVKKIKSDNYTKAVGKNKFLIICEGASARGGIMPILGREGIAYFTLKGKPLNVITSTHQKFLANKELTELYQIIKNENFEFIVSGTDQDLDGIHINSLILGFVSMYFKKELENGKFGRLQTPVFFTRGKNKKPLKWYYNLRDVPQEEGNYQKGLGSWEPEDLEYIINKDGLESMISIFEGDNDESLEEWLGSDSAPRKKYIQNNDFELIKV